MFVEQHVFVFPSRSTCFCFLKQKHVLDVKGYSEVFIHRAERYGSVYRINVLHSVCLCIYSPEATKVNSTSQLNTELLM